MFGQLGLIQFMLVSVVRGVSDCVSKLDSAFSKLSCSFKNVCSTHITIFSWWFDKQLLQNAVPNTLWVWIWTLKTIQYKRLALYVIYVWLITGGQLSDKGFCVAAKSYTQGRSLTCYGQHLWYLLLLFVFVHKKLKIIITIMGHNNITEGIDIEVFALLDTLYYDYVMLARTFPSQS